MNASTLLLKAVQNNADWCDSVAKANGRKAMTLGGIWYCAEPMPTFYPNIITLTPGAFDVATFNDLMTALPMPWCIRDSFSDHQSRRHTYQQLFEAQWYFCEPQSEVREPSAFEPMHQAHSVDTLNLWTAAWGQTQDDETVHPPELLDEGRARFVWLGNHNRPQCGASLFFSNDVLGITNLFGTAADQQRLVRTIQLNYPDRPLVGYGDQANLTLLKPFGFRTLGSLTVLVNP